MGFGFAFWFLTWFSVSGGRAPSLPPDPVVVCDSTLFSVPFTLAGNLILLQAKADTLSGYYVMDTGAPGLVLNSTYFRDLAATAADDRGGITGQVSNAARASVDSLRIGPVHYYRLDADVIDLGHIENRKGVRIFGLLGVRLFEGFEMVVDYRARRLYLRKLPRNDPPGQDPFLQDTLNLRSLPFELVEDKIIIEATLKGKKLKFIIDSGAETNILDSRLPSRLFDQVEVTRRVTLTGSGSQESEALYGKLRNLKLGTETLGVLPVVITNLDNMCLTYNYCLDGMLGFDFLTLRKIGFNFNTKRMYLWK